MQQTTYSPIGSGKQRSRLKPWPYTDVIVTMCSADSINHTPCIVITHNPALNPKHGWKRVRAETKALAFRYGIDSSRVIYIPSTKRYPGEKPFMYERFIKRYMDTGAIPPDALILRDNGNAFTPKKLCGDSIFAKFELEDFPYPAAVHQYLSPNDNKLHGCKAQWYRDYHKYESGVEATFALMRLIDEGQRNCGKYFRHNILEVNESDLDLLFRE